MLETTLNLRHHRCHAILLQGRRGVPIVFLHGYSFTSEVWRSINVLHRLEAAAIPFLCLDMPYGKNSRCSPKTREVAANVTMLNEAVRDTLHTDEAVLVGASVGGYIALHYAICYTVLGLLLIAPVRSRQADLAHHYPALKVPVTIIHGSNDSLVSRSEMRDLAARLPVAELREYPAARHPAYLDDPERFKTDLLELYGQAVTG